MSEPYVGEIRLFAGNYAPEGWAPCDGRLLEISGNEVVFTLIGTTYGGDGITNFALPDLRGRLMIGESSQHPLGQSAGTESVTLKEAELPVHTHTPAACQEKGTTADPSGMIWAISDITQYSNEPATGKMNAAAIAPTGGSLPHDNMMPFLVCNYIIALNGIFPDFEY
ncbi:phage tail protein [Paenibacillus sp. NEAU-GSW1]|uniref:phage tail protein n=1 Tax=Paenibacillus sp. NEAU-GSW1 TaxID=2682486 RepID=UPI0012E0D63F|nr:tail fiber protein [Paenibacillus sp. NEAU-GSW1]MUT64596.1 phage tail protein [Paenibacillus sp. NEAU-GSW1]